MIWNYREAFKSLFNPPLTFLLEHNRENSIGLISPGLLFSDRSEKKRERVIVLYFISFNAADGAFRSFICSFSDKSQGGGEHRANHALLLFPAQHYKFKEKNVKTAQTQCVCGEGWGGARIFLIKKPWVIYVIVF